MKKYYARHSSRQVKFDRLRPVAGGRYLAIWTTGKRVSAFYGRRRLRTGLPLPLGYQPERNRSATAASRNHSESYPELESYSRRTGARLALGISQAHKGDFLVKLKSKRQRKTDEVVADLRKQLNVAVPGLKWEFAGILGDLIGDLTWSPRPIEIKLFSTDVEWLKQKARKSKPNWEKSKVSSILSTAWKPPAPH